MSTIEQFTAAVPAYLGFFQDKSPCTQALKAYVLDLFTDFVSQEYPGQELTPKMALAFRRTLYDLEPNTVAQYMKHIRSAFKFMLEAELIQGVNPVNPLYVGREKYQPYDSLLTQADIQRILRDECPEQINGRVYVRARAMTLLCLSSGLRLAELLALTPEDLDWEDGRPWSGTAKGTNGVSCPSTLLPRRRCGGIWTPCARAVRRACPCSCRLRRRAGLRSWHPGQRNTTSASM